MIEHRVADEHQGGYLQATATHRILFLSATGSRMTLAPGDKPASIFPSSRRKDLAASSFPPPEAVPTTASGIFLIYDF